MTNKKQRPANTGLAKVAVQFSADTFVAKIATFAKPETVGVTPLKMDNNIAIHIEYNSQGHFENFEEVKTELSNHYLTQVIHVYKHTSL